MNPPSSSQPILDDDDDEFGIQFEFIGLRNSGKQNEAETSLKNHSSTVQHGPAVRPPCGGGDGSFKLG
jgi:hypothetical protein